MAAVANFILALVRCRYPTCSVNCSTVVSNESEHESASEGARQLAKVSVSHS